VATFIIQEGQALNFARPVSYVSDLLVKATTTTGLVPLSAVPAQQNVTADAPEFASVDRCLTNGDAVTALKILNTLKEKYADSPTLWFKFGYTYYELNLLEDAVSAYRHALTLEPADAIAWTNLGVSLAKLNRHQDAIEAGKQAIKVKPDYPKAWGLLGSEYVATEQYHEATEAFNQAAQLDPSDPEIWRGNTPSEQSLSSEDPQIRNSCDTRTLTITFPLSFLPMFSSKMKRPHRTIAHYLCHRMVRRSSCSSVNTIRVATR